MTDDSFRFVLVTRPLETNLSVLLLKKKENRKKKRKNGLNVPCDGDVPLLILKGGFEW